MKKDINDKPIIKTFLFDNNYFMYDTYTNNLFRVTKEHFLEIKRLQKIGITRYKELNDNNDCYKDIIMLLKKGLMKEEIIQEVQHPETEYVEYLLKRCVNDMTLQVTKDCNFRCRYCLYACDNNVERSHEQENMTWTMAKNAIDFLYKHSVDADEIRIAFYGGEPLLNFSLISDVVEYTKKIFLTKQVKYSMTVNGSLLSDSIINFLIQNKFELSISLDGAETIQNRHRKFGKTGNDTFSVVYKNVLKLRQKDEKYFQENVFFLPVIIEDEKYQGVLDFYEELGVKKDNITPLRANLNGVDYIFSISEQRDIPQLQNMMIDDMERANLEKLQKIFDNKQFLSPKWHHNGQCIPGVQRVFVDTHGKFFPCEKITEDKTFSIGDLEQGFDNDKIVRFLNIGKLTEEECKTCWAMRFCDMCVSQCNDIDKKKLTKEQKLITCKFQKEKTLSFFKYYINNRFKCFL